MGVLKGVATSGAAGGPSMTFVDSESETINVSSRRIATPLGRPALMFSPYYRAGGRRDRTWRLTWMPLAPEPQ